MRITILILTMLMTIGGFVFGQSKDEQEIRQTINAIANALVKNDTAVLANHYHDSYAFTNAEGQTTSKAAQLKFLKNTKREAFNYGDTDIRVFGNAAVVIANPSYTAVSANGEKWNAKDRVTITMVKNNGRWQIAAAQSSVNLENQSGGSGSAEQEIRQTLDKIADALTRRDADAMANYWADNHTFTNRNGELTNKAARLASLKSGQPRPGAFKYEDVNIRLLGANTAVVSARPTYPIKFANGQMITVSDRATMTMAKMNGRWQIVATHSSWDNPETGDNAAVEKQIGEIMTNWGNAIGRRDVATIEKILPPNEFMTVSPDGKVGDRTQYLEFVKTLPGEATVTGKATKPLI